MTTPPPSPEAPQIRLIGLSALPEVTPGMDLADLARAAVSAAGETFQDGDVLVVTHKIVAKAEGRLVDLRTVEPSELARECAALGQRSAPIEVVLRESVRIVRMDRGILISQTRTDSSAPTRGWTPRMCRVTTRSACCRAIPTPRRSRRIRR